MQKSVYRFREKKTEKVTNQPCSPCNWAWEHGQGPLVGYCSTSGLPDPAGFARPTHCLKAGCGSWLRNIKFYLLSWSFCKSIYLYIRRCNGQKKVYCQLLFIWYLLLNLSYIICESILYFIYQISSIIFHILVYIYVYGISNIICHSVYDIYIYIYSILYYMYIFDIIYIYVYIRYYIYMYIFDIYIYIY